MNGWNDNVLGSVSGTYQCPVGWADYGDYCYHLSNAAYSYNTSRQVCVNFGGDLMAQNSVGEKVSDGPLFQLFRFFLCKVFIIISQNFTESLIFYRQHDIWFGLYNGGFGSGGGEWVWTDGTTPSPTDPTLEYENLSQYSRPDLEFRSQCCRNWSCEKRPSEACNEGEYTGPCGVYRWHSKKWENHPCDWSKPFMCRRRFGKINLR